MSFNINILWFLHDAGLGCIIAVIPAFYAIDCCGGIAFERELASGVVNPAGAGFFVLGAVVGDHVGLFSPAIVAILDIGGVMASVDKQKKVPLAL